MAELRTGKGWMKCDASRKGPSMQRKKSNTVE
jgi:hypothetical protein